MINTLTRPSTDIHVDVVLDLNHEQHCEALLDGKQSCKNPAVVIVWFKSHGCPRDGKGVMLCADCRDWIASNPVGCGRCNGTPPEAELFITTSVAL